MLARLEMRCKSFLDKIKNYNLKNEDTNLLITNFFISNNYQT
jgi:hypothetical protein